MPPPHLIRKHDNRGGPQNIAISVQTGLALMKLGTQNFSGLAPREVFTWSALLTLKGFVSVGGS